MTFRTISILALSGSLRAASYNTRLLHAVARLAPAGVDIAVYQGLGALPLFNPDLALTELPAVVALQQAVAAADGILIASPEYAHGVSGVMKNALDWLVGSEQFPGKPVALLNASPRATHAQAALVEILNTMSARIVSQASIALPLLGSGLDQDGIVQHATLGTILRDAIAAFAAAIQTPECALIGAAFPVK
ncbi:NADPH-dependent FMN reductase [Undibacterium arcticum]|uniref:NADPH-dependent FMN reductase n=1 Tax=Undibacterium arcticum TaxID=1762892 RepID=A0ABV7F210_9BURK